MPTNSPLNKEQNNDRSPRCDWCGSDPLYQRYHDEEWGSPVFDDQTLFEFLLLEGTQAGLAWITVLRKRENYRKLFDQFDAKKIARYNDQKISSLLENPGIIRNRLKIESARKNARAFLELQAQQGSFAKYLWNFVDGQTIQNHWQELKQVPASTPLSDHISRDLKKQGFNFVGSTIVYAYMQAVGLVNDHLTSCFRHQECQLLATSSKNPLG